MKVLLVGSPQAGQQQLFSLLSGMELGQIQQKPLDVHQGNASVLDPKVAKLAELYQPKKTTYARIDYCLLPDFNMAGPSKELLTAQIRNADELCWIARSDTAETDIANFLSELVVLDLILAEKRLENLKKESKKKADVNRESETKLMEKCKGALEEEKPLRQLDFTAEEKKLLQTYQFVSLKPIILVVNVPEDKIHDEAIADNIQHQFSCPTIQVSAEIEQEISQLAEEDRAAFAEEMGIKESALAKMARLAFWGLGLISFFTVGEDEVRAWPVRRGSSAPEAAGVIHSDLTKGFVRAEMFKYEELIALGSEKALKEAGKFHLKGKDYIVEDADILSFRSGV